MPDAARQSLPKSTYTTAAIAISSAGNNTVIAAPAAGLLIRIWKIVFLTDAAVTVTLKNGSTALSGAMSFGASSGYAGDEVAGINAPLFVLSDASAFVISLGGAIGVNGFVNYDVVSSGSAGA